ncbi:MAG: hypothetical protein JOZ07_00235 [Solirubrobacterales bacterium]|nr:hypothetical protein [Solirubrobacterales bacterium]
MTYLNCPRCGLKIHVRTSNLTLERCPRCLGRAGISIPMFQTSSAARRRGVVSTGSSADEPVLTTEQRLP